MRRSRPAYLAIIVAAAFDSACAPSGGQGAQKAPTSGTTIARQGTGAKISTEPPQRAASPEASQNQLIRELHACGIEVAPNAVQIGGPPLDIVDDFVGAYRFLYEDDASSDVTTERAAKEVLCTSNARRSGLCGARNVAVFWSYESIAFKYSSNIMVARADGKFFLAARRTSDRREYWEGCGGYCDYCDSAPPTATVDVVGPVSHVRAYYTSQDNHRAGCLGVRIVRDDLFFETATGKHVLTYRDTFGVDSGIGQFPNSSATFPIDTVLVRDGHIVMRGSKCRVEVPLP